MCNVACVVFGAKSLMPEEIRGKRVLEVGAYDVNGTLRPIIEAWQPTEYVGVDLVSGPGVDVVCPAEALAAHFGPASFDVVISTEMLEHVRDWRTVVRNLKQICRPGGIVLLTTRSPGYPYHAHPHDFWRYTEADMRAIFADCDLMALESDLARPGVFLKAIKRAEAPEVDLAPIALVSILTGRRQLDVAAQDFRTARYAWGVAKDRLRTAVEGVGRALLYKT